MKTSDFFNTPAKIERGLKWFNGDREALRMAMLICELAHIWDDLIDRDRPVSDTDINRAFRIALVDLPTNKFYAAMAHTLPPLWTAVISAYDVANRFEREGDRHELGIAHGLRFAGGHILACASIMCHGHDAAQEHITDIWRWIFDESETIDEYMREHQT